MLPDGFSSGPGLVPSPPATLRPARLELGMELRVPTICSLFFAISAPTRMGAGQAGHGCRGSHLESPESPHAGSTPPPDAYPTLRLAFRSSIHTLPSVPTRQHPSGLHHCRGAGWAHLLPTAPGPSLSQPPPPRPRHTWLLSCHQLSISGAISGADISQEVRWKLALTEHGQ